MKGSRHPGEGPEWQSRLLLCLRALLADHCPMLRAQPLAGSVGQHLLRSPGVQVRNFRVHLLFPQRMLISQHQ